MRIVLVPAILLTLFACVEDVGKDKVKAVVQEVPAAPAGEVEAPAVAVDRYEVDVARSRIRALGAKITATHPIDFKSFDGKVGLHEGKLHAVSFEVAMANLVADHPKLTAHLLDEDFFDVAKHPASTFVSRSVEEGSTEEGYTHTISGDLNIRGTTKRITFPAKVTIGDGEIRAVSEFVLNRQDFGVTYPGRPDDLVQDNVRMDIQLVASK